MQGIRSYKTGMLGGELERYISIHSYLPAKYKFCRPLHSAVDSEVFHSKKAREERERQRIREGEQDGGKKVGRQREKERERKGEKERNQTDRWTEHRRKSRREREMLRGGMMICTLLLSHAEGVR